VSRPVEPVETAAVIWHCNAVTSLFEEVAQLV
jgi:hypothetical protein